ncbi:MAG: long-chain fatty acid--CoA ligase [Brevefilum sp.]|nr:long-chain fatty acid--CoA ligase [Brevefilum sp.]
MKHKPWFAHYDDGVPREISIPRISLVDLLHEAVHKFGDSTCTICGSEAFSYQQIDDFSDRFARYLLENGLKKGDRVGILLPNTASFVIAYYGILKAGGVVMAMNPAYRIPEIERLSVESGIRFLVLPEVVYDEIKGMQGNTYIEKLVVVDSRLPELSADDISWEQLIEVYAETGPLEVQVSPDDPAIFQYSGGTTGTPKCAIGLHRNLVANVYQFNHWLVNTEPGKETVLVAIPIYHVYGMVLGMNLAIKMGARMVLIPDARDLDGLLKAAEEHQATVFPGVPNLYAAINHYPPVLDGKYNLSSIKACISGSATLPLKVKQEFESLTHGHLVEGYGLSEAPTATHCNPVLGENRDGSIGLPLPNVDCKIVDIETGERECSIGEAGELWVRGPQVMAGYHQRPEESANTLVGGWLRTGDVVRMDEDGYFYIVDRKKDVIKVGGFQVWPNEIEAVLFQHPKIREAAVAGITEMDGSEVPKAWVVLREGQSATAEELVSFCDRFLTRYKIPQYFEFRESLPRTRVGKVLRRELVAEHYRSKI